MSFSAKKYILKISLYPNSLAVRRAIKKGPPDLFWTFCVLTSPFLPHINWVLSDIGQVRRRLLVSEDSGVEQPVSANRIREMHETSWPVPDFL